MLQARAVSRSRNVLSLAAVEIYAEHVMSEGSGVQTMEECWPNLARAYAVLLYGTHKYTWVTQT